MCTYVSGRRHRQSARSFRRLRMQAGCGIRDITAGTAHVTSGSPEPTFSRRIVTPAGFQGTGGAGLAATTGLRATGDDRPRTSSSHRGEPLTGSPLVRRRPCIIGLMADPALSPEDRARRIKVLLFDVDGVLTDGSITIIPGPDGKGTEVKSFSAHDGMGIALAHVAGLKVGWITKRQSQVVNIRARDLRIDHLYQGQHYKVQALDQVIADEGCTLEEICYVGDDIIDLPVLRKVGFAVATANARPEVKAMAHLTTTNPGGFGAGRDVIDFLLKARGVLEQTIEQYLDPTNTEAKRADIGTGNM